MKSTKQQAGYRRSEAQGSRTCHRCAFMQSDGGCQLVEGQVGHDDVCDLFTPGYGAS